ncbi:MAG: hypothetical protein R3F26_08870 [Gammaproteobacteria bacterium]|nr:hypothetical protein [Pseudomonadales bacterium]MCP5330760.1 hypothetical protein [Pseudomonadales bacterium]
MMKRFAIDARFIPLARRLLLGGLMLALVACASSAKEQEAAEQARAVEVQRAQEQAAAAARAAEERSRIARQEAERQAEVARQEAQQRAREAAEEAARQAQREEAARLAAAEQARRAAQAREDAQRARIAQLEAQIADLRDINARASAVNSKYEEAIVAAEALLEALNAEQQKYANTNAAGEPVVPLDKAGLADLEARKDSLKREAQALSQQ